MRNPLPTLLAALFLALGVVPGAPAQTITVTVTATDSSSPAQVVTKSLPLTVLAAPVPPLVITTTSLPAAQLTVPYNQCIAVSGGTSPVIVSALGLPAGMTISANCLTGVPTSGTTATGGTGSGGSGAAVTPALPLTTAAEVLPQLTVGVNTDPKGWLPFGPNYPLNQPIDTASVSPLSPAIIAAISAIKPSVDGAWHYNVVDSTQTPFVTPSGYGDPGDTDLTQVPITSGMLCEGTCGDGGDDHMLIIDKATGILHEFYGYTSLTASYAHQVFDTSSSTPERPYEMTSLTAGGLSAYAGVMKYDEMASTAGCGHALRVTFANTFNQAHAFMPPASHASGLAAPGTAGTLVFGQRLRLAASWQPAAGVTLDAIDQAIVACMKKYGVVDDDNGTSGIISMTNDARWNWTNLLNILGNNNPSKLSFANFEVVDTGEPIEIYSAEVPKGTAPVITTFTAAKDSTGQYAVFSPVVSGATYEYVGGLSTVPVGGTLVVPYAAGTYTLTARNQYGTSTATLTLP